jgi:hypothetical protein
VQSECGGAAAGREAILEKLQIKGLLP